MVSTAGDAIKMSLPTPLLWPLYCVVAALYACSGRAPEQALGTLERDRVVLRATASEIIVAQPVTEGSKVSEGDLLVQLDPRN